MDLEEKEWRKETAKKHQEEANQENEFSSDRVRKTKKSTVSSDWLSTVN